MSATTGPRSSRRPQPRSDVPGRRPAGIRMGPSVGRAAISVVLAALLLSLSLSGCGSDQPAGSASAAGTATATLSVTPKIENGVQIFDVVGTASLEFSPSTLIAKPGKITVNLTVERGSPLHNFVIPTIPAARTNYASTDTPRSVTFTVDQPGQYPFVCTIHPNMRGTLTIS
ncbi:cupredoxin domain-containing protein [Frankia sp. Cr1]|uniref:cupredoxin domain-containing protein n=1 Tax=Frankia sp. Cr1 TaxID=3073931 RepID=UPI002AD35B08|nr:cupredoxin domain-containing protein [Frankia sp. Cr1]